MTKPALIVGLGNTGRWVLTWLKRDLMRANHGAVPNHVRLLGLDTSGQSEARKSCTSTDEDEAVEVDGVTLASEEFVDVGENSLPGGPPIKTPQNQREASTTSWFPAQHWINDQGPGTFILDEGAGRLRQFGRMAVFRELTGRDGGTQIGSALRSALSDVGPSASNQNPLEIIVIGALAGGTGSSFFIETSLIVRHLARQLDVRHILRGVFVLPSAFTGEPNAEDETRAFAALREIDRSDVRLDPKRGLFDACYRFDGQREGQPDRALSPRDLSPALSEVIAGMLDESESNP